jgi:hypothetical protein
MPRTYILHHGCLPPNGSLDLSILKPDGYYKIIAVDKTPRNTQAAGIRISREVRDELNALKKAAYDATGNRLTQDDVIANLLAVYRHTGVALCDW